MKEISFLLFFIFASCASKPKSLDPMINAMETKQDEYRQCYLESDSYGGRRSVEKGSVKVAFTVDMLGKPKHIKIHETTFKDPNFHACLMQYVKQVDFPVPKEGASYDVVQNVNFGPPI